MATGRLGAVDLSATTNTSVYKTPDLTVADEVFVNFCNRNASTVSVRLALVDGDVGDVASEDYIIYDYSISANGHKWVECQILSPAMTILAYSDTANVSVVATGKEKMNQIGLG
jgi:hypothetical protein